MQIYSPGTRIGQYEIASRPMMGGMGVVYFALDHGNDGRPVALKTFRPELLPNREARDRFLREGTAWVNLMSHPHIVRCHKVEYIDPTAFLVLELIAKEQGMEDASLRAWMGSPMKVEQALLFALQIARGMQHATEKIPGFVHRDLKPENVLVGADKLSGTNVNRLRITDFGLVMILKEESGRLKGEGEETHLTRGIVGTPLYMAPEQWNNQDVGVYTDVYALGCILYEMLTSKHVVDGKSVNDLRSAHCEGKLRSMSESMSREMKSMLGRCLSLRSAERYQAWEDVTQGLEEIYTGVTGSAVPVGTPTTQMSREERMQECWSQNAMGLAYRDIGKADVAKIYFEKSLSIARETGNQEGEGAAFGNLGAVYYQLGEMSQALRYYEKQLAVTRKIKDRCGEVRAMEGLGNTYADLGEVRRAIEYHEQSLTISREIGDRYGEGVALGNLGSANQSLGEIQRAIGYHEQYFAITLETNDRRGMGNVLGNLGNAYQSIGEMQRAIGYYKKQLDVTRQIGDRRGESYALGNLGVAYYHLGEVQYAIECYEQQLEITLQIGERRGEGYALGNLGIVYKNLGNVQRAIEYYEKAIVVRRAIGDINGLALDSFNMAVLYCGQGEISRALLLTQESERIWLQVGSPYAQHARQFIAQLQGK